MNEKVLLKHMQLLIAVNAFRDEMIINQVMWTDAGIAHGCHCGNGQAGWMGVQRIEKLFH
jgi:hypothetical protein